MSCVVINPCSHTRYTFCAKGEADEMVFKTNTRLLLYLFTSIIVLSLVLMSIYGGDLHHDRLERKEYRNVAQKSPTNHTDPHECETVHIAFLLDGIAAARKIVGVVRSIVFYRRSPLHFHFVLDNLAENILKKLFDTWELPFTNYSFYSNSTVVSKHHLSPVITKLLLPSVLPPYIDKIIVLDANLTVIKDISDLWKLFSEVHGENKLLGVFKNLGNSTLQCNFNGRKNFNTDVILLDLQAIRKIRWNQIIDSAINSSKYLGQVQSNVIDTLLQTHHRIYHLFPCKWNVPCSIGICAECPFDMGEYGIINWNTLQSGGKYRAYFEDLHKHLMQYDSSILQNTPLKCGKSPQGITGIKKRITPFPLDNKLCNEFNNQAQMVLRTHIFFYGQKYRQIDNDVTLVTQISADRLPILNSLIEHWVGPISLAVYCTDNSAWQLWQYLQVSTILRARNNVAIHVVYKEGKLYPLNYLRNVALNAVSTSYVFLSDGDFLPMYRLHSYLKNAAKVLLNNVHKRALVVPAFEAMEYNYRFPTSKKDLITEWSKGSIQVFHKDWSKGHGPTNYKKWAEALYPYNILWSLYYEPYILVESNVARYDESFMGYGWNKASQIMELKAQGYEFVVLPNAFIIHSPHPDSIDRYMFMTKSNYLFACVRALQDSFTEKLTVKYGVNFTSYKYDKTTIDIGVEI